jgi:hypothetical protein
VFDEVDALLRHQPGDADHERLGGVHLEAQPLLQVSVKQRTVSDGITYRKAEKANVPGAKPVVHKLITYKL